MSYRYFPFLIIAVLIIAAVGGLLLKRGNLTDTTDDNSGKIRVAATIFPLADIARNIGGEYIDVALIIPPGSTEHSGALTPQQLSSLQQARAIFQVGHGLDDSLAAKIINILPAAKLVTVDKNIAIRQFNANANENTRAKEDAQDSDSGPDPHYWLTVPNATKIAENIAAQLQTIDPQHAADYQTNLTNYRVRLENLEKDLQKVAVTAPQKNFIAMHNAWSYLAEQYGFELAGTYEPREGKEPSVADIQRLQQVIQADNIKVFYTEPQKQKTAATKFLTEDFGLTIKVLDPVGGVESRDSYINLMRFNMRALTDPL